mmetsp:Transcript_1527/g.6814  ORF Transcript_1527/g.6814 Transcript_1527/m.6814 type:complete len:247 (+) Transcript_1527:916-1656(+)
MDDSNAKRNFVVEKPSWKRSLGGERERHGVRGVNLEPLEPRQRHRRLRVRLELHERDPWFGLHHAHLLETRKLLKQHGQHRRRRRLGQALHEENLVGGRGRVRADLRRDARRGVAFRLVRLALLLRGLRLRLPLGSHLRIPRLGIERTLLFRRGVRLGLRVRDAHGLVVEREALHSAHGLGCGCHVGEDHPRLPSELVRLRGDDVDDLAELAEDGLQRLLQLILLGLFVQVVDVDRRAGRDVPHAR